MKLHDIIGFLALSIGITAGIILYNSDTTLWYHWVILVIIVGILVNISQALEKAHKRAVQHAKYAEAYGQDIADLIMAGEIEQGMTTRQVQLSLGKPDAVSTEVGKTQKEIWKYGEWRKGAYEKVLYFEDEILVGYKIR